MIKALKSNRVATAAAVFLVLLYIGIFSYLSIVRYLSFNSHYYDLGIMDQVVFNTSQGRILRMTDPDIARNTSRFAVHFDPLLVMFAPLYMIVNSPINLLVAQTIIIGLGGIAVYLLARQILKHAWLAVLFVFLYLNFYPLQLSNLFDFHAVTIATTALLFAFYFLATHPLKKKVWNYVLGTAFLLIILLAKENAALVVAFLCAYLFYTQKRQKIYLILSVICFLFFGLIVFHVIPFYRSASSFALSYFDPHHPLDLIFRLFSYESYMYLRSLLAPFGFLPLLAPLPLLIALPELLINLVSSNSNMRQLHFHYTAMITPFLVISAIYGFQKIRAYVFNSPKFIKGIVILLIFASLSANVLDGTFNYPVGPINKRALAEVNIWRHRLRNQNIRVSATGTIAPFFTEHRRFYYFLFDPAYKNMGRTDADILKQMNNYKYADYVIINKSDVSLNDPLIQKYYSALVNDTDYTKISDKEGIEVYRNISRL